MEGFEKFSEMTSSRNKSHREKKILFSTRNGSKPLVQKAAKQASKKAALSFQNRDSITAALRVKIDKALQIVKKIEKNLTKLSKITYSKTTC